MKSFKKHLEESWRKKRFKDKLIKGHTVFGRSPYFNQRLQRLFNAKEKGKVSDEVVDNANNKDLYRKIRKGLEIDNPYGLDVSQVEHYPDQFVNAWNNFNQHSRIRGDAAREIDAKNKSNERARFVRISDQVAREYPNAKPSQIKFLQRSATRQRKLGLPGKMTFTDIQGNTTKIY